jgi:hypothetical protein
MIDYTTTQKIVYEEKEFVADDKTSKSLSAFKDTKTDAIEPRCLLTTVLPTFSRLSMNCFLPHGER